MGQKEPGIAPRVLLQKNGEVSMQKIFVIEDDENIRNLVKIALEGYGYQLSLIHI